MQLRSLFFGGLAMLAAAMFMHAPARAIDYEPPGVSISIEWPEFALLDMASAEVALVRIDDVPKPNADARVVTFASQNQPLTAWRFAVDAYSRIDPHIHGA